MIDPAAGRSRRVWLGLARGAGTLAIVAVLLVLVDASAVLRALRSADPLLAAAAASLFVVACAVSSWVWLAMLGMAGYATSPWNAFRLNLVGFLFNSVIPSGLGGDMWRAWIYHEQETRRPPDATPRASLGASFATVVAERWVAFGALTLLTMLAAPLGVVRLGGLRFAIGGLQVSGSTAVVAFSLLMAGAFGFSVIAFAPLAERSRSLLARLRPGESPAFLETLVRYRGQWIGLGGATALNLLSPLLESTAYWLLARSLGIHLDLFTFVALTPVLRLLHHFPLTVDAVGVQDVALMATIVAYGLTVEQGLALSLLMHAAKMAVAVLGLALYAGMLLRPAAFGLSVARGAGIEEAAG